jgi:MSHA biogenesis protein MshJ
MDALKAQLQQLTTRINALSLRERVLLSAIVLGAVVALGNTLIYQPASAERKRINSDIAAVQQQITALNEQISAITANQGLDPNQPNRTQLATVKAEIADLDAEITNMMQGLIEPAQMVNVLEEALAREPGLTLVRVKNLSATTLTPAGAEPSSQTAPAVYQHGLTIELDGNYLATLRYLKALEALPWRLFWGNVTFQVQQFPQARITITVHTLSLKEGWIGV